MLSVLFFLTTCRFHLAVSRTHLFRFRTKCPESDTSSSLQKAIGQAIKFMACPLLPDGCKHISPMYKSYLKQALALLKENKAFSLISIAGTALAICMIMVMVVTYQIRIKNYPPENHRDRMLYIRWADRESNGRPQGNGFLSIKTIETCLLPLTTPEAVAFISPWRSQLATLAGGKEKKNCLTLFTDDVFWRVFDFHFLDGAPYTPEDVKAGLAKAVISASVARRLYGTTQVAGQTLLIGYKPYTISGVVSDVSSIAKFSYADIWVSWSSSPFPDDAWAENITGWYQAVILARSASDFPAIRQEIARRLAQYNATLKDYRIGLYDQPDTQLDWEIKGLSPIGPDKAKTIARYLLVVLLLLFVPALNLSGLTLSQMRKRMAEIGVRKAFGATRSTLLMQILTENMILTLLGGIAGLALSYIAIYMMRTWLLSNSFTSISTVFGGTPSLPAAELFNPVLFLYAFLFCLVLNLLSAGIPAYRLSGKQITEAFHTN